MLYWCPFQVPLLYKFLDDLDGDRCDSRSNYQWVSDSMAGSFGTCGAFLPTSCVRKVGFGDIMKMCAGGRLHRQSYIMTTVTKSGSFCLRILVSFLERYLTRYKILTALQPPPISILNGANPSPHTPPRRTPVSQTSLQLGFIGWSSETRNRSRQPRRLGVHPCRFLH